MLIIKKPNKKIFAVVAKELKRGAVIVYPTDTAYGLGCDATNAKAVAKIFKIKGRVLHKGLPIICADMRMVKKYFGIVHYPLSIVHKHWPGPLSIVVKAKRSIARNALEAGTAAVRVPNSHIARTLSKLLGRPLIATSANMSGIPACYSIEAYLQQYAIARSPSISLRINSATKQSRRDRHARSGSLAMTKVDALADKPDLVLDAGALPRRKPSTIVRIAKSGIIEVLRKGPVKILTNI